VLNKKLILLFVIVLLSITSFSLAQKQEIKDYKVLQGDTLWDISKKELNDPFLWPKVWKENPDIANPDKLMPGQTIKIPLYLIQKEVQMEEPVAEPIVEAAPQKAAPIPMTEAAPVKIRPLVDANLYISSGYLANTVNDLGSVTGSPSKKNLSGTNDLVYLTTKEPAKIGDRFYVIRKREVIHPISKARAGNLVQILGVAEVTIIKQGETIAKILKSYEEITLTNLLIPYSDMPPPVVPKPYRRPKVEGYIVAARDMRHNNGMFDIVYLDKGKNAGLEVGDLLRAISVEKQLESYTKVEHKYPHGIVQIIKVYDTTSVAIIQQAFDSILPGYLVIQYD
jgi:LysM repeat protein